MTLRHRLLALFGEAETHEQLAILYNTERARLLKTLDHAYAESGRGLDAHRRAVVGDIQERRTGT